MARMACAWWLGLAVCACVGRAPAPAAPPSIAAPPFIAWLEAGAEPSSLTLAIAPLRRFDGPFEVEIRGRSKRHATLGVGRHTLALEPGERAVRVVAAWRDASGVAGAVVVLDHPALAVTRPVFEPIIPLRLGRESSGPTLDQAIHLR